MEPPESFPVALFLLPRIIPLGSPNSRLVRSCPVHSMLIVIRLRQGLATIGVDAVHVPAVRAVASVHAERKPQLDLVPRAGIAGDVDLCLSPRACDRALIRAAERRIADALGLNRED